MSKQDQINYPCVDGFYVHPNTKLYVKYVFGQNAKLWIQSNNCSQEVLLNSEGAVYLREGMVYHIGETSIETADSKMTASKLKMMAQYNRAAKTKTDSSLTKSYGPGINSMLDVQNFIGTLRGRKSRSQNQLSSLFDQSKDSIVSSENKKEEKKMSSTAIDEPKELGASNSTSSFSVLRSASNFLSRKKKESGDLLNGSRNFGSRNVMGSIAEGFDAASIARVGSIGTSMGSVGGSVFFNAPTKAHNDIEEADEGGGQRDVFSLQEILNDGEVSIFSHKAPSILSAADSYATAFEYQGNGQESSEIPHNIKLNVFASPDDPIKLDSDHSSMISSKANGSSQQRFCLDEVAEDTRKLNVDIAKLPQHHTLTGQLTIHGENKEKYYFKLENYRLCGYFNDKCDTSEEVLQIDIVFSTAKPCDHPDLSHAFILSNMPGMIFIANTEEEKLKWVTFINTLTLNSLFVRGFDLTDIPGKNDASATYRREIQSLQKSIKATLDERKKRSDSDEEIGTKSRKHLISNLTKEENSSGSLTLKLEKADEKIQRWGLQLNDQGKVIEKNAPCAAIFEVMVEKLIEIESSLDMDYIELILTSYRHVGTPDQLFHLLIELYILRAEPDSGLVRKEYLHKWRPVVRLKIFYFLKKWIADAFFDFVENQNLLKKLNSFVDAVSQGKLLPETYEGEPVPESLNNDKFVKVDLKKIAEQIKLLISYQEEAYKIEKPMENKLEKKKTLEFAMLLSDVEIAHALTKRDFELYSQIRPIEFYLHLWANKEQKIIKNEIKNLQALIERFNTVSYWVATEICTQPELKNRIAVVERMILIAKELKRLNNFNSLMAIMSGLNVASVQRLKATWDGINVKLMKTYTELEEMVSPQNNFGKYREIMSHFELEFLDKISFKSSANTSTSTSIYGTPTSNQPSPLNQSSKSVTKEKEVLEPAIPIISLFLKDLLFMSDGNPKMLSDVKMINFSKLKSINTAVCRIILYQRGQYEYENISEEAEEFCGNLRVLKEAALYKYSTLAEPRAGEPSQRLIDKWVQDNV